MIASHYAAPVARTMANATPLREAPAVDSEEVAQLRSGDPFELLDDSRGWAWGYGGAGRLVGYVPSGSLS